MAWDEWEQLKKQAAERGESGSGHVTGAAREDGAEEPGAATERVHFDTAGPAERVPFDTAGPAEPDEYEAARRMARIRHTIDRFRDTTVLVPLAPLDGGGLGFLTADFGGVRWIHAFTDALASARFDEAHDVPKDRRDFVAVQGWRLLDVVIPAMDVPCGVALDVGSGGEGVLLPPVVGIVPEAAAVDAGVNGNGERAW
ncbi:hypothetical protein [Streptomyces hygroscopicus]|uniref:hypothetical protein n=1 Tax=Streptomyces hygroscopicus TaxID=1912 RepID=UPI002240BAE3|nr:hypothetical protein [Streptomyces hygroscopicus]